MSCRETSIIDFYTLDVNSVNEAIKEFKNSKVLYALLGKRLNISEGESCATASYMCLEAGGIENLLRFDQQILSKKSILTPSALASYAIDARKTEHSLFKQLPDWSKKFLLEREKYMDELLEKYSKEIGTPIEAQEERDSQSPKHTK